MELNEAIALIQTPNIISHKPVVCADLGCGSGLFTRALATMLYSGSTIYGVDKTSAIQKNITNNNIAIEPVKADFEKDDLPFSNLDGILMANALHYVEDKIIFINKLKRLLKPDAFLLIVEYDTEIPVGKWVPYPVSYGNLQLLFKNAGFQHIQKTGVHPSRYGNGNLYSSLILP